jgi:hypothetical protein
VTPGLIAQQDVDSPVVPVLDVSLIDPCWCWEVIDVTEAQKLSVAWRPHESKDKSHKVESCVLAEAFIIRQFRHLYMGISAIVLRGRGSFAIGRASFAIGRAESSILSSDTFQRQKSNALEEGEPLL